MTTMLHVGSLKEWFAESYSNAIVCQYCIDSYKVARPRRYLSTIYYRYEKAYR